MIRQEKADRIRKLLTELYPAAGIPLDHMDPFTLLVAVVLSAQTTDKKVNEVTPASLPAPRLRSTKISNSVSSRAAPCTLVKSITAF